MDPKNRLCKNYIVCGFCINNFLDDSRLSQVEISMSDFYAVTDIVFKIKKQ